MDDSRLQSQLRALSREVGTLKEELVREAKRRERLAVRAKECEAQFEESQAKVKSLAYVNRKLEQELATIREKAQATGARSRSGLEALRERLAGVEQAVAARAVEAQRQLGRVRNMLQDLAAEAVPLAVLCAAATTGVAKSAPAQRANSLRGSPAAAVRQQQTAIRPVDLQRRFAQVLAGLSQLSEAITGRPTYSDSSTHDGATTTAPLLLTAPDGSTRPLHRRGDGGAAGTPAVAGPASVRQVPPALDAEKEQLRAQVQQLQAELSAAHAGSGRGGASGSRLQQAMAQLETVVPQYRAAASALQGQVTMLQKKLAGACRERSQLQEEASRWQSRAQQLEAAYAGAAAKVHASEAQALVLSSQQLSHAEKLNSEVEALRQRCSELGARLRGVQQEAARLQAAVGEKDKLISTQQATIRQLEATIADQHEDIRSALDLVTTRAGGPAEGDAQLNGDGWDEGLRGSCGSPLAGSSEPGGILGLGLAGGLGLGHGGMLLHEPDSLAGPPAPETGLWSIHAAPTASGGASAACCSTGSGAGYAAVSVSPRPYLCSPAAASSLAEPTKRQRQRQEVRPKSGGGSRGVASIEEEIAGLEDALRQALTDLNI